MNDNSNIVDRAQDVVEDITGDATRMVREIRQRVNPMDTTSLFLTFGVTIVALILGLFVWSSAVGGTRTYRDATGLNLTFPSSWASSDSGLATNSAGTILVRPPIGSTQQGTQFQVERITVDAGTPATTTLGLVANDIATTKGRALNAFRVLSSTGFSGTGSGKTPLQIKGQPGYRLEYAYVDTPGNALSGTIPKVILGESRLVAKGDKVYVFTLESTEANHAAALPLFDNFVDSAQIP